MFDSIPYCFVKECNWLQNWSVCAANPDFCSCLHCLQGSEAPGQQRKIWVDKDWSHRGSLHIPLNQFIKMITGYHSQTPKSTIGLSLE